MRIALAWIAATMITAGNVGAAECVGLLQLHNQLRIAASGKTPSIACGSLKTVLSRISNRNRTSGRKLEQEKPLDFAQAQRSLDSAMSDAEIRQRIEQMRRDVQDEQLRLAYEAAILDEEGHYDARDLRIQQLTERIK